MLGINYSNLRKFSSKDRRHDGWEEPTFNPEMRCSKQYLIDNCLEPRLMWDDWGEWRDGCRNGCCDKTKLTAQYCYSYDPEFVTKHNNRIKKKLVIRQNRLKKRDKKAEKTETFI